MSIARVATRASDVRETSNRAEKLAGRGALVVGNALRSHEHLSPPLPSESSESLNALGRPRSQEIDSVVSVIREIADQDQICRALECCHRSRTWAGESGQASPVADEVRKPPNGPPLFTVEISRIVGAICAPAF